MADRYWVGGSATWDNTAGTKWSTTSGGPGGASRTFMQGRQRVYCNVGDTLDVYSNGASGKTITGGYSQLVIKQVG